MKVAEYHPLPFIFTQMLLTSSWFGAVQTSVPTGQLLCSQYGYIGNLPIAFSQKALLCEEEKPASS